MLSHRISKVLIWAYRCCLSTLVCSSCTKSSSSLFPFASQHTTAYLAAITCILPDTFKTSDVYSVDEFWHVPHFEKMLYDNPQLVLTYLDTFRVTGGEEQYAFVARGVLDYLRRDMTHPEGGIYSAEVSGVDSTVHVI